MDPSHYISVEDLELKFDDLSILHDNSLMFGLWLPGGYEEFIAHFPFVYSYNFNKMCW